MQTATTKHKFFFHLHRSHNHRQASNQEPVSRRDEIRALGSASQTRGQKGELASQAHRSKTSRCAKTGSEQGRCLHAIHEGNGRSTLDKSVYIGNDRVCFRS